MRLPGYLARHSDFIGNVAKLMSGKAVAAMIAIFTLPIVARLFEPSHFGVAALFMSITNIVSRVAPLQYEAALVLPKEDHEARMLMALTYRLLFGVCALMLLFFWIFDAIGVAVPPLEALGNWKWLLPLGVLLMATIQIQEQWLTRVRAFGTQATSLVVANASNSGARIGFGALYGSSVFGLIAGDIIGMTCRLAVQRSVVITGPCASSSPAGWATLRRLAWRYSDFPKFNAPATLIFSLGQNLPILFFAGMFSPAVAGFYAMAKKLSHVPASMVSYSMRRVFLQKAASIRNRGGSLTKAFLLATGGLALLAMPLLAAVLFFGEQLLTWFLGERWSIAGQYLEIMAPWLFMLVVMAPCNPVFIVLRQQKLWLLIQIALTTLRLVSFGIAFLLGAGPEGTLRAFVLVTVAGNLAAMTTAYVMIKKLSPQSTKFRPPRKLPRQGDSS
jgi:O-antigen/teichoic acid export membrane protein